MRTRLSTRRRREQLLTIGAELFAARPYEEVSVDEVAEIASVSRGLLYHYFDTKREFFAAVVQTEADRILRLTEPDPALPVRDQLLAGLDGYLSYVEQHPYSYLVVHRAAMCVDEEIRKICERNAATHQQRILNALRTEFEPSEAAAVAIRAWLTFVITCCLEWLDHRGITRTELRDICARTLLAAVGLTGQPGRT